MDGVGEEDQVEHEEEEEEGGEEELPSILRESVAPPRTSDEDRYPSKSDEGIKEDGEEDQEEEEEEAAAEDDWAILDEMEDVLQEEGWTTDMHAEEEAAEDDDEEEEGGGQRLSEIERSSLMTAATSGKLIELLFDNQVSRDADEDEDEPELLKVASVVSFMEIPQIIPTEDEGDTVLLSQTADKDSETILLELMQIPSAVSLIDHTVGGSDDILDPNAKYFFADDGPNADDYVSEAIPRISKCPSIESFFNMDGKGPIVNFYLFPGSRMISRECRLDSTVYQIKVAIGRYVKVPPTHLDIRKRKNLVQDSKTLKDLGAKPGKKIKFTVEINRRIPGEYEINIPKDHDPTKPKEVTRRVRIEYDDGTVQHVNVVIRFPMDVKPMLGGFVDKRTNKKFHHAATEMEPEKKILRTTQISTASQAYGNTPSQVQTRLDKGSQMEKSRYFVSESCDRILYAQPYDTYDNLMCRKNRAATIIQSYWRRHLAMKERERRMKGLLKRIKWAENLRMGRLKTRQEILDREIERQENPSRFVDLELLYRAINVWRIEQEGWVETNRWGAERKAALAILTDMETDLLHRLEQVKNRINIKERNNRIQRIFELMGQAKRFLSEKSKNFIRTDTSEKMHVRQLHCLYNKLEEKVNHKDPTGLKDRIRLLHQLNEVTKGFKGKNSMAEMLNDLITRELNFLRIEKTSQTVLEGLRRRISSTFLSLCEDPEFNPEATKIQNIPYEMEKLRRDMVLCQGCRRMQHRDQLTVVKGTTVTKRCRNCTNLYRTTIQRLDLNLYRHMLKELRREEMDSGVVNSVTFLMDALDLKFLMEQIWHCQSALSGIDSKYLLRTCRWLKDKPWTPWNCVLLTDEEATAHLHLDNLEDAYTPLFLHKVLVKQYTAKSYFKGISRLMIHLDERVEETCKAEAEKAKRLKLQKAQLEVQDTLPKV